MFDHVGFGVSDYAASKAFFLEALKPLGVAVVRVFKNPDIWRIACHDVCATATFESMPVALAAANRKQVDEFHRAAIGAGGKDNGAPGLRPHYHPDYYGAFVIGPDGHNIEAVCHKPDA